MDCDFDNAAMTCPRCGYAAGGRDWRKNCKGGGAEIGPGMELHKLLARFGIQVNSDCPCVARMREMNRRGPEWCEANIATIVGWLREEAARRELPFVERLAGMMVKRAIANSRRRG
jgi:hypothetical protein